MILKLYRGDGRDFNPDVPLVDRLLGDALRGLGGEGSRRRGECVFASTNREQAENYAKDGSLFQVHPEDGAVVTWVEGTGDLVLRFGSWLREASWDCPDNLPRGAKTFLRDIAGDVNILETYLSLGRQKRLTAALAKAFASDLKVMEARVIEGALPMELARHSGEVWITGGYTLEHEDSPPALSFA